MYAASCLGYRPFIKTDTADVYRQVKLVAQKGSQEALLAALEKEVCLGGPRGPGKTLIMLADFLQEIGAGWGPAMKGIILRRSMTGFDEFRSMCNQYISQIFPSASFNQNQNRWQFATGETLLLRYFDEVLDYSVYQGASFAWIAFEELTQWEDDKALRMMQACLRSTIPGIPLRIRATTNPDGVGHNWVKARYLASDFYALGDRLIGPRIEADDIGPARRMIYCRLMENQLLMNADPTYLAGIKASAVDEGKFEGWVNGSWEILSGDMFGDLWPDAKQYVTLPSVPASAIPPGWRIDRSFDWGDSSPFSVLWFAESDGSPITYDGRTFNFIRGDIVLFMEWFGQGRHTNTGLRLPTPQIRDGIIEREIEAGLRYQDVNGKYRSRVHNGPADSAIFNMKPGASDGPVGSIAEDFEESTTINGVSFKGITWERANKNPGSRILGWQATRSRIHGTIPDANGGREKVGLFVCERVRSFFDYVIVLPRDLKNNKEDIPNTGHLNDHTADALRYRLTFSATPAMRSGRVEFGRSRLIV